ncbi:MAG: hypothetical protein ABIE36_01610 [Candidatus Diapherotrites archaeon]
MLPKYHIVLGFIFSIVLFLIFPSINLIGAGIIFLSSFLIDFDHYVYYIFKKRDLNLKRAYIWFIKKQEKLYSLSRKKRNKVPGEFFFLHGIESLLVLFILGIYLSSYIFYILIGFALHLFSDIIYQRTIHDRLDKISLIYDWFKYKKLRCLG